MLTKSKFPRFSIQILLLLFFVFASTNARSQEGQEEKETSEESEAVASSSSEPMNVTLQLNQVYPLDGIVAQSINVSPPGLLEVNQSPQGILVKGLKQGKAALRLQLENKKEVTLFFWIKDAGKTGLTPWQVIKKDFQQMGDIHISQVGNKAFIQGEIVGRSNYQKALLHLKNFNSNIQLLASPAPGIKTSLMLQTKALLSSRGFKDMQILNAGNRFFLEGSVSTPEDIDRALELAQSLLPNIENHIAVPIKIDPTITMRIFILELSRRAHEVLGLSWPASVNPLASIQPGLTTFSPSWTLMLKHLATKGQAKILSEPVLSVKNGAKAELSAGGEIPLKIVGRYENKVTWKHYGLKVGIHIHGIAGKFIRTQIATESSQLDESTAVDGVPGIRSNKMSTLIDAREGQAVMLTGLFQSSASKDVEKMPLLGNIPILGELFKSREFRERDSELIVAILPSFGANETSLPLKSARGLEFDKHWHLWD